ncbi:serine hydrolase [Microbacterium sp. NPDC058342]|uniref:serine hydrolase n=1 Tax=Microbacterium sp. NPDC058342 TaxID=3346454 RepID=UPI0036570FA4
MGALADELEREASGFAGRVGYSVSHLSTGATVARREDEYFPTASACKLPLLTAFHAFADEGGASWDDIAHIDEGDLADGSGILQHLDLPRDISLRDAAWLMICLSDNTATNILLRALTVEGANQVIDRVIGDGIHLDKFAGYVSGAPVRSMGRATPAAFGRYLRDLAEDRLPGAAATRAVAAEQIYRGTIPRYLPWDAYAPDRLRIANKTGSLPGICTDVAVLTAGKDTVTMAFMTDADEAGDGLANEGQECIARMARLVHDAWLGGVS